ncbi:MAG: hypothetical protein JRN35_04690 [Nitrososphaerota archaeon]|nr:hypothetical protein [Nitrososphaerota archaeon]
MAKKPENAPWVLVRAARPWLMQAPLPQEVAEILGFPKREELPNQPRHHRILFFTSRGPGVARVAAQSSSMGLYSNELKAGRVIATAVVSAGNHFYLPVEVQAHLELKTYPSPQSPRMLDTDDVIVWAWPVDDYQNYRAVTRTGKEYKRAAGEGTEGRCYIVESTRILRLLSTTPPEMEAQSRMVAAPAALRAPR